MRCTPVKIHCGTARQAEDTAGYVGSAYASVWSYECGASRPQMSQPALPQKNPRVNEKPDAEVHAYADVREFAYAYV